MAGVFYRILEPGCQDNADVFLFYNLHTQSRQQYQCIRQTELRFPHLIALYIDRIPPRIYKISLRKIRFRKPGSGQISSCKSSHR